MRLAGVFGQALTSRALAADLQSFAEQVFQKIAKKSDRGDIYDQARLVTVLARRLHGVFSTLYAVEEQWGTKFIAASSITLDSILGKIDDADFQNMRAIKQAMIDAICAAADALLAFDRVVNRLAAAIVVGEANDKSAEAAAATGQAPLVP